VSIIIFDPPATPTRKRTGSPRPATGFGMDEGRGDTDTLPLGATSLPSSRFGEAERFPGADKTKRLAPGTDGDTLV